MRNYKIGLLTVLLILSAMLSSAASPADDINIDVKEFQLDNGMLFLVVERHATPQVAVRMAIRAGSAHEESGKTGIAHLLEHMMFKGTKNFGTLDVERDRELQEKIEAAYQAVLKEQGKRRPDREFIRAKKTEMDALRSEVQKIYIPQAFSAQLGKNGAVGVNAFTTTDQTQYIASVPSDMLEQWFSIASEQIFEPSWREFYVEKEVVQREWAFRYVNNPNGAAWLDLNATAYTAHPYRNPTIGWKSDMEKFNTTDAIEFHRKHYNPSNAVCVLVGDLTLSEARQLANTYFARYPAGERTAEIVTEEPEQQGARESIRYLKGARTPLVRIGFHGARMGTNDFYALDAMTMILSQGRSARITRNIVNRGLAVEAWAYNPDNRYGGMVVLGGSPTEPDALKNRNLSDLEKRKAYLDACRELKQLLMTEARRLQSEPVTDQELQIIRKLNERDFLERMRSNESLAGTLASLEVQIGWRYLNTYLQKMAEVTPEDIRRVARKTIRSDHQTTVFVIPGGEPDKPPAEYVEVRSAGGAAAAASMGAANTDNHSVYPTPAGWKHPLSFSRHPDKIRYPAAEKVRIGETEVFYLKDDELPLIYLTIVVKAGAVDLPKSKSGLAALLASSLITGGTETYSPDELARVLDENAIELSVSVNEEDTLIRLSMLKADWEKGLALLDEIINRPAFNDDVLRAVKDQEITGLKRQGGDAQAVAVREAMIWHFKGHPYGRDPLDGLQSIPKISKSDLKEFLTTYFVPANMVVAVSGDITRPVALSGVGTFLRSLPDKPENKRQIKEPQPNGPVVALIHKPGQVQSQVIMLLDGVKRTHPDYWKMSLLADVFGGSDSMMYTRLRDDLGLVYSAGFFQRYKWNAGMMIGYIGCKADQTATAIAETVNIMESLRKRIPEQQVERKRLESLNGFVFNVDTSTELVNVYARYQIRGEPLDTLERIQDAFIGSSPQELLRIARQRLDPARLQVFIVADKNIPVQGAGESAKTLEDEIEAVAKQLNLPYQQVELR